MKDLLVFTFSLLAIWILVASVVICELNKNKLKSGGGPRMTKHEWDMVYGKEKPLKEVIYKYDADGDLVYTNNPDKKHLEVRK